MSNRPSQRSASFDRPPKNQSSTPSFTSQAEVTHLPSRFTLQSQISQNLTQTRSLHPIRNRLQNSTVAHFSQPPLNQQKQNSNTNTQKNVSLLDVTRQKISRKVKYIKRLCKSIRYSHPKIKKQTSFRKRQQYC